MNLGPSVYAGVFPDPKGQPPSADRQMAGLYRESLRRDPPGAWASNRYLQSQQYVGTQYVAIKATWSWLAGSTVIVERERQQISKASVRKATQPGGLGNDDRYHPVEPSDDLAQLFEYINATDTFQDFIAQLVIQIMLTGNAHIWLPRNEAGRPSEMWVLPSVMLQPQPGGMTADYPFGGYRLQPNYGLGWGAVGIPAMGNVPLDAREVVHYREPHALLRWDGYGATQAMARQIDQLNGVETSRTSSMAEGLNPSAIIALEGINKEQADDLKADIRKNNAGADKAGGILVVGADKASVELLSNTPKDMDYPAGWEQSGRAVLAGYRIPPVVAGIIEANYAEFWGAVRAWFAGELRPFATRFGSFLTKRVARPAYGRDYRVRLQLPAIDDPDMLIQQHSFTPNDLFTVNEHRAAFDVPPLDGGDVPLSVYTAQQNQAAGMGPDGQPLQPAPGEAGADPNAADMADHPLNAVGDEILKALGVDGGSDPGNDPFGGDDDDGQDTDPYADDDAPPFSRKAFGKYDEAKHKRNHGQFSSTGGAHGAQRSGNGVSRQNPANSAGSARTGNNRATLSPQVARHPKVRSALQHLASKAGEIAQRVNAAMLTAGIGPDELIGDQSSWERWFCTQHADAVAAGLGVDSQTAVAVLSHLVSHGVAAIKKHLTGGGKPGSLERPSEVARPGQNGDTGADIPRPDNPHGEGSLPSRVKAFGAVPELDAFLETLV